MHVRRRQRGAIATLVTSLAWVLLLALPACKKDKEAAPVKPAKVSEKAAKTPKAAGKAATDKAATGSLPAGWKLYKNAEGGFEIAMPGTPTMNAQQVDTAVGKISLKLAMLQKGDIIYVVGFSDYPEILAKTPSKNLLDGWQNGAVTSINGKAIDQADYEVQGYPARRVEIKVAGMFQISARAVVVGARVYQVMFQRPIAKANHPDSARFFDSFKISFKPKVAVAKADTPAGKEAPAAGSPSGWKTFSSKAGRYTVLLPGVPKVSSDNVDTALGKVKLEMAAVETTTPPFAYMVGYSDYPKEAMTKDSRDGALSGWQDGVVNSIKAKVYDEKKITMNGHPGREFHGVVGGAFVVSARAYVVDNRLYQLLVQRSTTHKTSPNVKTFFESFRLQ